MHVWCAVVPFATPTVAEHTIIIFAQDVKHLHARTCIASPLQAESVCIRAGARVERAGLRASQSPTRSSFRPTSHDKASISPSGHS